MTIGFRTLDVGQQAIVYNHKGEARIEEGPQRIFLWREKFQILKYFCATQTQYLKVSYIDGKVEHLCGPLTIFQNPLHHKAVKLCDGTALDANEALVVYRKDNEKVQRYIKHGPTLFIPQANEWLHEFCWHGQDPASKANRLPGTLKFTKLQVIPDQFYYNVNDVRTSDDAQIRVKLMLFYELSNIEQMLEATQDPIADFINCLEADVIAFSAKLTYMEFIEQSNKLNILDNYPQLLERCKGIGYTVTKVVFRGYFASPTLQSMHDNAIQARTKIKIDFEREEQEQEFTDANLRNEFERSVIQQKMELEALEHKQSVERQTLERNLSLEQEKHAELLQQQKKRHDADLAADNRLQEQDTSHLTALQEIGVDIHKFLLSKNAKPQKVIQVKAQKGNNIHLHQNV